MYQLFGISRSILHLRCKPSEISDLIKALILSIRIDPNLYIIDFIHFGFFRIIIIKYSILSEDSESYKCMVLIDRKYPETCNGMNNPIGSPRIYVTCIQYVSGNSD